MLGPGVGCTTAGGRLKSSSARDIWVSFFGDMYAGGGECVSAESRDSLATWNERWGALRAMSCFSERPELEELSEDVIEIAGGGGTGGGNLVIEPPLWCVGRWGVLWECS